MVRGWNPKRGGTHPPGANFAAQRRTPYMEKRPSGGLQPPKYPYVGYWQSQRVHPPVPCQFCGGYRSEKYCQKVKNMGF
jgi:hypothetical protein